VPRRGRDAHLTEALDQEGFGLTRHGESSDIRRCDRIRIPA
jgi:hypothetical protein